jgi:hypothetical protein
MEPSDHILMSVRLFYNLSTDMNSSLQVSETGHIVWTATFYLIFLEVYVKCVFRTSNKAAGEFGNRIVTLSMKVRESPQMKFEEKIRRE